MSVVSLALVDGEHYPPVVRAALDALRERGRSVVAALFLGGFEKTAEIPDLGIPVHAGDPLALLPDLLARYPIELVIDLSDEPVLDHRRRMRLVASSLAAGVAYEGADFRFDPPARPHLTDLPTVAVSGMGKRTGKTAVAIALARHWNAAGRRPVIVTMGRGGPAEPVVLRAGEFEPSAEGLRALARQGLHAASDYVEDAVFAGVDTVGTRRAGGGIAGASVDDTFAAGVAAALELDPGVLMFEGSGTAVPPARADASVLVMRSDIEPEYLIGYAGPYRLLSADAAVVIEVAGRPADGTLALIHTVVPELPGFAGRYRSESTIPLAGRHVVVVTTAAPEAGPELAADLEHAGAHSVHVVHALGDRRALPAALESTSRHDLVLTEVKAAAVDVVVPWAEGRGVEVGFVNNAVDVHPDAGGLARLVEAKWP